MSAPATIDNLRTARSRPARRALVLPFDPILVLAAIGLGVCSLVTIAHATQSNFTGDPNYFVSRQAIFFAIGLVLMLLVSRFDYSRLREMTWGVYGILLLSIVAVDAFGQVAKGSQRSLNLPFFAFQPSELGKLLLCIALAGFLTARSRGLGQLDTTIRALLLALIPAGLVVIQPDLGSGMVYVAIVLACLFVAGTPGRHFAILGGLAAIGIVAVFVIAPMGGVHVLHGYQADRLTSFLHPSDKVSDAAYQQHQSVIAFGSGEKTGRGDAATQTKLNFLPESHTDFIFAVVGETWGFAGAAVVLALYAMLIWRGLRAVVLAKNLFGSILAGGIVAMLMFQVFINVGMNVGIMPITGIPLALMSYGGSSVITTLLAIGLLQSILAQGRASAQIKGRLHSNL
jgi:rod shape determining protein RodA